MSDEDGFTTPLDDDVLSLWNTGQFDLNLGKGKDIGGSGEGAEEFCDSGFGYAGGEDTEGADHEI